jgi:hypothetical protein
MMRRRLLVAILLLSCATRPSGPDAAIGYPGTLVAVDAIEHDFQWQQRVTARWPDGERAFDAVLSKSGDELLLVGLGPMKSPGFFVRYRGGEVELENRTPEDLPFEPRYIILDIQRVYYPWIPGEPPTTGDRHEAIRGESIHERWQDGRLRERRFVREDGQPPGEITIRYEGWEEGLDAPSRAILDNGWLGYSLVIDTLVQERLDRDQD